MYEFNCEFNEKSDAYGGHPIPVEMDFRRSA